MASTADYFTLEYRASAGRFVVRPLVDEIPLAEYAEAAAQLADIGRLGNNIDHMREDAGV